MEIDKIEIVPSPTDIRDVVTSLFNAAKPDVDPAQIQFTCHVDSNIPSNLLLDPARLEQALSNLVGNAVKYTQKGRIHIHVTLGSPDANGTQELNLIVADTGQGISEAAQRTLFQPSVPSGAAMAENEDGSGIGLAITKGLARLMGGDLTFLSKEGRGSEFKLVVQTAVASQAPAQGHDDMEEFSIEAQIAQNAGASAPQTETEFASGDEFDLIELEDDIYAPQTPMDGADPEQTVDVLPIENIAQSQPPQAGNPVALDQLMGLSILIVEDIPANQEILRSLLEPVGCQVSCAGHGRAALDMMSMQIFDAVLMDIRMPVMNGIETTISIRKTPGPHQNVAIIALTADASAENNAECLAAGADVFLTKPVVVSELFSSIRYARRKQFRLKRQALSA